MKHLFITILLCLSCLVISADGHTLPEDFDVQGHRGARGLKPENTLPAFEVALDLGVTTLELDMHYTADNRVVIWHDDAIKREFCRLPEGVELDLPESDSLIFGSNPLSIRKLTLEQIQSFHCDAVQSGAYRMQDNDPTLLAGDDYRIPTLTDVFDFVDRYAVSDLKTSEQRENAAQVRFNIESKRKA
ncbi:MAG: glycerophosphodiester phosphodiesterase family protein, partial [Aggregatilineales bacterium]